MYWKALKSHHSDEGITIRWSCRGNDNSGKAGHDLYIWGKVVAERFRLILL